MKEENVPLPVARIGRAPPLRLKDPVFLNELGAVLTFFGLFLMMCVVSQRSTEEELAKDPFMAGALVVIILVTFLLAVSSGCMAIESLLTGGERPRSFLRHLGAMFAGVAVSLTTLSLLASGITRLILPLQMFFGWLGMSAGFTLLYMTRKKKTPPT